MHDSRWLGDRLRVLRARSGMSIRRLARESGVSIAMVSYVERGSQSPSMVTLQKLLEALGSSLPEFFSEGTPTSGAVFRREQMRVVSDEDRTYALLFDPRADIGMEMTDEHIRPGSKPDFARLTRDIAGYVVSGQLLLEIQGEPVVTLRTGDAFYVNASVPHRGYADEEEARLITVQARTKG